jgi:hypothetical protein
MRRLTAVLLLSAPIAWADRVVLKSGGSISGVIVERNAERVLLDVGPGRIGVPMARVERIENGGSALAAYRERASRIAPGDAEAWLELGYWARERDLETQARQAFEAALQADPGLEGAHRGLGHVRHGDGWLTLDESYRARGFVPFDGGWVTPAEREAVLQDRAASEARSQAVREAEARAREAEARAEGAEAAAREAERQRSEETGFPYWWIFGSGCSGPHCGLGHVKPPHARPPFHPRPPVPEPIQPPKRGTMR